MCTRTTRVMHSVPAINDTRFRGQDKIIPGLPASLPRVLVHLLVSGTVCSIGHMICSIGHMICSIGHMICSNGHMICSNSHMILYLPIAVTSRVLHHRYWSGRFNAAILRIGRDKLVYIVTDGVTIELERMRDDCFRSGSAGWRTGNINGSITVHLYSIYFSKSLALWSSQHMVTPCVGLGSPHKKINFYKISFSAT